MNKKCITIVNNIYKEIKNNIDIINYWFETDNKKLDQQKLFKYVKYEFTPVLETENDIYVFFNKMINNIMYGKSFEVKKLNYLEANFVSLANIVIEEYNKTSLKR